MFLEIEKMTIDDEYDEAYDTGQRQTNKNSVCYSKKGFFQFIRVIIIVVIIVTIIVN